MNPHARPCRPDNVIIRGGGGGGGYSYLGNACFNGPHFKRGLPLPRDTSVNSQKHPFLNMLLFPYMGIARKGGWGVIKRLPGWFAVLFWPHPNGQFLVLGGVRTLAKMVCALVRSFWQCQKR